MKVAYVAGPFRAANAWKVEQNIRRAESVAAELWKMGFAVICPHANSRFFSGLVEDQAFLDGDIEILKRCDLLVLVPDWRSSSGTIEDVRVARKSGIPIYVFSRINKSLVEA